MNRQALSRSVLLSCAVSCLLFGAAAAQAGSFAGTSAGASSAGSSGSSGSSSGDDKLVQAAREDAAGFVASDGRIRSARLEAALRVMRQREQEGRVSSDLELARKILASG